VVPELPITIDVDAQRLGGLDNDTEVTTVWGDLS